jgi:lysophospholipase L1-like esterase
MKPNKKSARAVPVKNTAAKPAAVKTTETKSSEPANKPLSPEKLRLFKWLAILFPFVLIVLLELILRLFNYGHNTALFVKYPPDENYMVMNHYASDKFFPDTAYATTGNQEIFAINKAPNTIRIFVLGESTTIGFPFRPNGSFHRWLQYRLSHMYPDKNFEIVNLALTAVNSYTVLDFGKQLAQYKPDAVLIYVGHNEYYGALGIGSTTYVGSNRFLVQTLIKLRGFKVVQLINNIIDKVKRLFAGNGKTNGRTLMEVMAARQHIAYNSPDYKAGIAQFDENMTELCSTLDNEKIATFLSTVESNEKDLPPFVSDGDGPTSANGYFRAGQAAFNDSSFAVAKQDFDKAKELDQLRFRAPDAINTDIRKIAGEFPNVHLVDTKKFFEQYSPHGIIGKELVMEHVHPNLLGYAVMSEAFYQAIQQQNLIKDKPEREYTLDQLRHEMPITTLDTLNGTYQMMILKTGFPFNQPISKDFRIPNSFDASIAGQVARGYLVWDAAMGQVFTFDRQHNNPAGQLKIAEAMILQYPQIPGFYTYAGNLNTQLGNYAQAAFYFRKLYMLNSDANLPQNIFKLYLEADDPVNALKYVSNSASPKAFTAVLAEIINDETQLKTNPGNKTLTQQIAADYNKLGLDNVTLNSSKN